MVGASLRRTREYTREYGREIVRVAKGGLAGQREERMVEGTAVATCGHPKQ